jgi:hypothetical protein
VKAAVTVEWRCQWWHMLSIVFRALVMPRGHKTRLNVAK